MQPTAGTAAPPDRIELAWVAMDTAETGWGRTSGGEVVYTEDAGATWRRAGPGRPIQDGAVLASSGGAAWIADPTEEGIAVWRTTSAGATWIATEIPRVPDNESFLPRELVFPEPGRGWLLVELDGAAGTVFVDLYATSDGGASWNRVTGPPRDETNAALESGHNLEMDFNRSGRGWVTKDFGAAPGAGIAATGDGGSTWREITIPDLASSTCATRDPYVRDVLVGSLLVECADASAWYATTPDDGVSWDLVPLPEPAVQAFQFEDGVFAWGDGLVHWTGPPEPFQLVHEFPRRPTAVSVPDAAHAFAVMDGELWRSDDQGRTWTRLDAVLAG